MVIIPNRYRSTVTGQYISGAAVAAGAAHFPINVVIVNWGEVVGKAAELDARIKKAAQALQEANEQSASSFNVVMNMMRGTYMIIGGMVRVIGGGFSRIFQGMWSVAVAAIGTYTAIAGAISAIPGAQAQAAIMFISLLSAISNVTALAQGQTDIARQARGINFAMHGISAMISAGGMW